MSTIVLARNIASGLAAQVWTALIGLAVLPIYVRRLGPADYGLLALCLTVVGVSGIMDLGIGRSLGKYIAEETGPGQSASATRLFRVSFSLALSLGLAGGFLCVWTAPWVSRFVFHVPGSLQHTALLCLEIIGLGLPSMLVRMALEGLLVGYERLSFLGFATALTNTIKAVGGVALLLLGYGLPYVIAAYVAASYVGTTMLLVYAWRGLPQRFIPGLGWDGGVARKLFRLGSLSTICSLMMFAFLSADRILIAWLLPFAFVGYYTGCLDISSRQCYVANNIAQSFLPVFSAQSGRDPAALASSYRLATRAVAAGSSGLAAVLIAFAHPVLDIWLGSIFSLHGLVAMGWLCLGALIANYVGIPSMLVFAASDRPEMFVAFYIAAFAMHVGLSILLVHWFSLAGVAIAYFASYLLVWYMSLRWVSRHLVAISPAAIFCSCILPSWIVAFAVGLPAWLWVEPHIHRLWSLLAAGMATYILYLGALAFIGFSSKERIHMRAVSLRVFGFSAG